MRVTNLKPMENGRNYSGDKEQVAEYRFITKNPRDDTTADPLRRQPFTVAVQVRVWMGRSRSASTVYASVWAHSKDGKIYLSGRGSAGGYGYHKESAAIKGAMESAGVTFDRHWGGGGESAIREAMHALAKRLGWGVGQVM